VSQMSVSEVCLDGYAATCAGRRVLEALAQCETRRPKPDRRHIETDGAALDLAHSYGSGIRHEDDKTVPAVMTTILRTL
jgi:hypothetical protein